MKPKLLPIAKEIIPKWEKKIRKQNYDTEIYKAPIVLSLQDFRFCIVGEGNGWSDDYLRRCEHCRNFSFSIANIFDKVRLKKSSNMPFYHYDQRTIKPYMIERLISRTNRFLEHFIKVHKKS